MNTTKELPAITMSTDEETSWRFTSNDAPKRGVSMTLETAVAVTRFLVELGHSPQLYKLAGEGYAVAPKDKFEGIVLIDSSNRIDYLPAPEQSGLPQAVTFLLGLDDAEKIMKALEG